jgi:membrane protein YqaA with SNARE-associated domain
MQPSPSLAVIFFSATSWLLHLGGPGLILLAIIDHSFIPLPGSLDALTVILAARDRDLWFYYAFMATLGSMLGGYITYRIGKKGGEEALEKKVGADKAKKVQEKMRKGGFLAVFVPALMPPPVPLVPFLVAAGAMEYPWKKFLLALGSARVIRYFIVAYLGSRYGEQIIDFFRQYYQPVLWAFVGLAVVGGVVALFYYLQYRKRQKQKAGSTARESSRESSKRVA